MSCTNLAAVIPCYNAGHRVRPVAEGVLAHVDDVHVVDDGCTDGCIATLDGLAVRITRLEPNRGKGHAIIAGLRAALANPAVEAVCLLDADGQHDPAEIPRLFAAFREHHADLVIGARSFGGGQVPWRSRFGNRVTAWVTARVFGRTLPDTQCGFRILSRRFAEDVIRHVPGGRYETEMAMIARAIRADYPIASVPIATRYEPGNASSHFRKFQDSWRIYRCLAGSAWASRRRSGN